MRSGLVGLILLTAGTLDMARGDLGDFLDWWVVLRSLIDGREPQE